MFRAIAAAVLFGALTAHAGPAGAQETRIEEIGSGSVVVTFPDSTRVVLDEDTAARFREAFENALLSAGTTATGGDTTSSELVAGLESDTSQYGIEEALQLESALNAIIASDLTGGDGATADSGEILAADDGGEATTAGDEVFNPVADLTDPEIVGDEDIPASGAR